MKKYLCSFMAFAIVLMFIGCKGDKGAQGPQGTQGPSGANGNFSTPPSNATILFQDSFDSYAIGSIPAGWAIDTVFTGSTVGWTITNTTYVSYGQALMVTTTATDVDRIIIKAPPANTLPSTTSGSVYMDFYVFKPSNTKGKGFVFYINELEKCRVDFSNDGNIYAFTTYTAGTIISAYNANTWYHVDILLNLSAQIYSVYIDNILLVSGIPCYNMPEQNLSGILLNSLVDVYATFFGVITNLNANYAGDTTYLDNVLVYYLP